MSSKGYLILAQNSEGINYVRQAYALALSIKNTQPNINSVSIVTNDTIPEEYKLVFDNVIGIPWSDSAKLSAWKVENRWKLIHASPYDETIVLDSDMLFFKNIEDKWPYLNNYDVFFASEVVDYKGRSIVDTVNRKTFIDNQLPNVYFALHYFKKTPKSYEFYKVLEFVVKNWKQVYEKITPNSRQTWLSMDVSAAVALKILDAEQEVTNKNLHFTFTHMKPNLQGWRPAPASWINSADYFFNDSKNLFINQFKQHEIFHYTEDKFLTDEIVTMLGGINVK